MELLIARHLAAAIPIVDEARIFGVGMGVHASDLLTMDSKSWMIPAKTPKGPHRQRLGGTRVAVRRSCPGSTGACQKNTKGILQIRVKEDVAA